MNAQEELAGIVQNSCAQTGMDWVYDHEASGVAEAIIAEGYSKTNVLGFIVVDRGGAMVGNQHKHEESAQAFAAEWTKDCKDAGIDWDYRVATISEVSA